MSKYYLPVKILDEKYADKLMSGEVFMREMREFGSWSTPKSKEEFEAQQASELQNGMRKDLHEGTAYVVKPGDKDPYGFVEGLPDDMKEALLQVSMIDEMQKYTKLFCMSKLEYDAEQKAFLPFPARIAELGDSAVVILNPQEFYRRLLEAYTRLYKNLYVLSAGEVIYQNLFSQTQEWDIYTKSMEYNWQNEVRIAAELRSDIIVSDEKFLQVQNIIPIGDISDIAIKVSVEDLQAGKIPEALLTDEEQQIMANEKGCVPMGLTDTVVTVAGSFGAIGPYKDWITQLQKVFTEDEWTPVTFMEPLVPGGKTLPRLQFIHKKKWFVVKFMLQCVYFEAKQSEWISRDLIEQVLQCCLSKIILPLVGASIRCIYGFGDVAERYKNYEAMYNGKQKVENGLLISEHMEGARATEKTIFGTDRMVRKLQYVISADTTPTWQYAGQSLEQIMNRYDEMILFLTDRVQLREGEDAYERFCNI